MATGLAAPIQCPIRCTKQTTYRLQPFNAGAQLQIIEPLKRIATRDRFVVSPSFIHQERLLSSGRGHSPGGTHVWPAPAPFETRLDTLSPSALNSRSPLSAAADRIRPDVRQGDGRTGRDSKDEPSVRTHP